MKLTHSKLLAGKTDSNNGLIYEKEETDAGN